MTRLVRRPSSCAAIRAALLALPAAVLLATTAAAAGIPATPVMTLYRFNGPLDVPTYDADGFATRGTAAVAGSLAQGSSVVPCLVIRDGEPLTDASGTPFVGFEVVVDARRATPDATQRFREVSARRKEMTVENHHCPAGVDRVIDVRSLAAMDKAPFFDPPRGEASDDDASTARSELDRAVRAFHGSRACAGVQSRLVGRRAALADAWDAFAREQGGRFGAGTLERARNLDYVMRTAIYEGHLDRGCSAYGACERAVIALSIANRGRACVRGQGCRAPGDFEGVASSVSQYNIWDEVLLQITGLGSCFLRPDLARDPKYAKLQAMYDQSRGDVERILYGDGEAVAAVFPDGASQLAGVKHYYHPPAMGKCFPEDPRVEYMSGAVARRGDDFALIAGTRVEVGAKRGDGYEFRDVALDEKGDRDVLRIEDLHPGFVIDARKVSLEASKACRPWGTPPGCSRGAVGRWRKVPSWLSSGRPVEITCRVRARDESCTADAQIASVVLGGPCDVAMQPVAGVP